MSETLPARSGAPSHEGLDEAVRRVAAARQRWAVTAPDTRVRLLDEVLSRFLGTAEEAVAATAAHTATRRPGEVGQEWTAGPLTAVRLIGALRRSLGTSHEGARRRPPAPCGSGGAAKATRR